MTILEALALWKRVKPWLDKIESWFPGLLGAVKGLLGKATENPVPHPGADNPDKPVTPTDITNQPTNV